METWGLNGPWQSIALLLALLAVFAVSVFLFSTNRREKEWLQTDARARRGEEAVDALQREICRHTQLEQELLLAKQAAES
ncbi:MAG: response regulator, partial [Xanthomonadaceae bacterium]|nr:response regulator [Xanthomonadaceae bacterium]